MIQLILRVILLIVVIGVGIVMLFESVPLVVTRPVVGILSSFFFLFVMYWVTKQTGAYLKRKS